MLSPGHKFFTRLLDILFAGSGVVVLSPVFLIIAVLIRLNMGSPVIFRQNRAGYLNRDFEIMKFRTMLDSRGTGGTLLSDEQRLTRLGRFLRKSSLDETFELFNVLRGDMSLVGPRPLYPEYYPFYTEREKLRFQVLPGITGLAQISGRNYLGWDRKLGFDVQFVENYSVWLYLKILILTPLTVFDWSQVAADPYSAERTLSDERSTHFGQQKIEKPDIHD